MCGLKKMMMDMWWSFVICSVQMHHLYFKTSGVCIVVVFPVFLPIFPSFL